MRKSRIAIEKQEKLVEYFVCRAAAELADVNPKTAAYYFHRLRELIYKYQDEHSMLSGEIEIDESYSVKRPLGLEDIEKAREDAGLQIKYLYLVF